MFNTGTDDATIKKKDEFRNPSVYKGHQPHIAKIMKLLNCDIFDKNPTKSTLTHL